MIFTATMMMMMEMMKIYSVDRVDDILLHGLIRLPESAGLLYILIREQHFTSSQICSLEISKANS